MGADRHLSDDDILKIAEMITRWSILRPFGWEKVRGEIKTLVKLPTVDQVWSRQQLAKYDHIKSAFDDKKELIRKNKGRGGKEGDLTPRERTLTDRIQKLAAEKNVLQTENDLLHEKFERWLYNAHVKGVNEATLDKELPKPQRK